VRQPPKTTKSSQLKAAELVTDLEALDEEAEGVKGGVNLHGGNPGSRKPVGGVQKVNE
jgi:hypothetical protein